MAAACADSAARRQQADLEALDHALAGTYVSAGVSPGDAAVSSGGDTTASSGAATALSLSIAPIRAQLIGERVFFVRETAAGNGQLVLAQGIWTLQLDRLGRLQQHMLRLKDPRRWIGAAEHPELLLSLLPEDLVPLAGCELTWQRTALGFATAPTDDDCQPGAAAHGLWIERSLALAGSELTLTERQIGTDGTLGPAAASYTLQRRGAADSGSTGSQ